MGANHSKNKVRVKKKPKALPCDKCVKLYFYFLGKEEDDDQWRQQIDEAQSTEVIKEEVSPRPSSPELRPLAEDPLWQEQIKSLNRCSYQQQQPISNYFGASSDYIEQLAQDAWNWIEGRHQAM